ncbi:SDR family oxidoreductase [Robertkochia solimangrovi]|uniref:SDR family oxidoreductase n=1 Tax=Robertkochia solimangrovi TaxID=2213046 RepID=UPI00117CF233|nr:SDR family oxidoreductase [Robertkochia solimangrovi]TRZ45113.1 NAD-dependent dehydratase [Robertkochia solimangrovi]
MKMKNVLILGASGAIAQHTIEKLQKDDTINLTLFARNAKKIKQFEHSNMQIVEGDVLNKSDLKEALKIADIVYANLSGPMEKFAETIVKEMEESKPKRLVFVTSLGIYNEIQGKFGVWNDRMIGGALKTYRKAADIIEASNLDYTIVRPAWLQNEDEVDYETTQKGEDFKGTEVSRKSVGVYIADIIQHPEKDSKASVGVNKPGTEGDKPSFY